MNTVCGENGGDERFIHTLNRSFDGSKEAVGVELQRAWVEYGWITWEREL